MQNEPVYIAESKNRCKILGLDASSFPVPKKIMTQSQLFDKQVKYGEILSVAKFFSEKIMSLLSGTSILILISDDEGYILEMYGDEAIKTMTIQLGITYGMQFNEEDMGTNSIFLTLQLKKPVKVIGDNHYYSCLLSYACYSVPYYFPDINSLAGTITIMSSIEFHSPYQLALISNMIDSIEREILLRRKNHTQNLMSLIMMNTLQSGIVITDKFGYISEFNRFAEQITNWRKKDIICQSVFSFEPIGHYIYQVINHGQKYEDVRLTFKNSNSQKYILLFDALPIFDDHNELLGSYAQFRDITDRHELEKQVIVSEKYSTIGRMAAGLAHEIRNPLTSVTGFIKLLTEQSKRNSQPVQYFDIISQELKRMNKLVSDFVLMAKPSVPDRKILIAQDLLIETVQLMESQAILKNIRIDINLHKDPLTLSVDPIQMKQVFMNLIQNAIEAVMDNSGNIVVLLEFDAQNQLAIIQIKDNGIGMTEEEMTQIINPFYTTKENGLGLGLSVSYRIIENHDGKISVFSEKGIGTTFTIQLPIHHRQI